MAGGEGHYAVVITSTLKPLDAATRATYERLSQEMYDLARSHPGFLGMDYARDDALGITVTYWRGLEDIAWWRDHAEHQAAKALGRSTFYASLRIRICRVEREYGFQG